MENQTTPEYPQGKTIFKKYSTWRKGQHKSSVMQTVPGHKTQFIGKIYFEKVGEEKNYIAKSSDDREVYGVAQREYELEKWFAQEGHQLAIEKLEAEKAKLQAQTLSVQPQVTKAVTPEQELSELRARKGPTKGQSVTR